MVRIDRISRRDFFSPMSPGWVLCTLLFAVGALFLYWLDATRGISIVTCPTKLALGFPCPLCGGTTASVHLGQGRFRSAWQANPLVTVALPMAVIWVLLWIGFGLRIGTTLSPALVVAVILVALAANWACLVIQ